MGITLSLISVILVTMGPSALSHHTDQHRRLVGGPFKVGDKVVTHCGQSIWCPATITKDDNADGTYNVDHPKNFRNGSYRNGVLTAQIRSRSVCLRCPKCNSEAAHPEARPSEEPRCRPGCLNGVVPCEQDDCMKGTKGFTGLFSKHPCPKPWGRDNCRKTCTERDCKGEIADGCTECQNARYISCFQREEG